MKMRHPGQEIKLQRHQSKMGLFIQAASGKAGGARFRQYDCTALMSSSSSSIGSCEIPRISDFFFETR
jgi:hypothetical protein